MAALDYMSTQVEALAKMQSELVAATKMIVKAE